MKSKFAQESFTGLPQWAKGIIAVAVVGGVGFIAYKMYKAAQQSKLLEGDKNETKEVKNELAVLNINPATKGKLSPSQIAIYANSLHTAMEGVGTDREAIFKVFANMNNDADLLALIAAYGIRPINSGVWLVPDFTGSLGSALTSELSNEEIKAINMANAKKAIKYRF